MSNETFDVNSFVQESKEVLVNPKSYFSSMKTTGGLTEPLIKALIYGAIAGAITFFWSILHMTVGGNLLGGIVGIGSVFALVLGALIGLFVGGVILLVISSICKGSTDFEANVRVMSAVLVLLPVSALFGFTTHIHFYLGEIVAICIKLYSFWLLYNALVESLKAKPETTRIVMYVLIALVVIFTLIGIRKTRMLMEDFNQDFPKERMEINR